jgi:hypothetical protein
MKHPKKADSFDVRQRGAIPDGPAKRPIRKQSKKSDRDKKKFAGGNAGIRETEEARALLQDQLHNLYWWVFNACKMKGFIRAKGLHQAAGRQLDPAPTNATSTPPGRLIKPRRTRRRSKK